MNHGTSDTCAIVAVLTVSDTRSIEDDRSGAIATEELIAAGHTIAERAIVRDVKSDIASAVLRWAEDESVHAIVVTGGTGPSRRDVTPEAVAPLMSAKLSGFGELFRQLSYEQIGAAAMLSRAEAGWIDSGSLRTPVFLLPGSPKAVTLAISKLIAPQLGHFLDVCSLEAKK
jgi:molybdenum cofactor biosynthesis protein B|tara:strand:+ start:609 stop:1124 length:516 start_codon:yes stop_codon:yes gene_type:complete